MDLIYTDRNRKDIGVLKDYTFDLAFGWDENNFELTLDLENHCCEENCLIYIEGTEYGGIIDDITVITKEEKVIYKGRTWHGILASKVIEPNAGEDYFTVSNTANSIIGQIIQKVGLSDLFATSGDASATFTSYQFPRYIDAYSGLVKMLASKNCILTFAFTQSRVVLRAIYARIAGSSGEYNNDTVEMEIEQVHNTVNHLICLGKGELANRKVVHLYMDADGNVSEDKTFSGLQEITAVYDYPNAESLTDLKEGGTEKLQELAVKGKVQTSFASDQDLYTIGDIIEASEIVTGITAIEKITKKIVTINQGEVNIQYKVGE